MALVLLLVQLSVLLLSCFSVIGYEVDIPMSSTQPPHNLPNYPPVEAPKPHKGGHHHHHHKGAHPPIPPPVHPPTPPPVHSPIKPPVHPPTPPPVHPPIKPPVPTPTHPPSYPIPTRKLVAVQGVIYCKPCNYTGIDTLLGATPLLNATVRLQCNNTKYHLVEEVKTDKNGYFFIMPKTLTTSGSHKCKVSIVSSSLAKCSKPTNLHDGLKGAILMPPLKTPVPPLHPLTYQLFTVGPFAFESLHHC